MRRCGAISRTRALTRDKAAACAVALIDDAHIRVGCEAYAKQNGSHGAATLLKDHIGIRGGRITLAFRGKSGKEISCAVEDRGLAKALRRVASPPGPRLLQFQGPDGPQPIGADDVNAYLQRVSNSDVTAKDFRMLGATSPPPAILPRSSRRRARPGAGASSPR